jgi:hypothetical protein
LVLVKKWTEALQHAQIALQDLSHRAAGHAFEVPSGKRSWWPSQEETIGFARAAPRDVACLPVRRVPIAIARADRLDLARPVSQHHVDLLPIVRASCGTRRTGLMETRRFFSHAIQPATFAVQPATRTRKCERERHIPHHVRNLENEITKPNANRLIAQHAIVHCEGRRHGMA